MSLLGIAREFRELPLGLIDDPEVIARTSMDDQKMDDLVSSIRDNGLISPISVVAVGDRYEVVAGHRRTIASKRAGLAVIPSLIYPTKTAALESGKVAENVDREEWSAADEAIYYHELLEKQCDCDTDRLCDLVKRKRAYVEGRLLLFQGCPEVFAALQGQRIQIGVAHQLNKCTDALRRRSYLHSAIVGGATVAVVAGWIMQWQIEIAATGYATPAPVSTPGPAPIPLPNPFLCVMCGRQEHEHTIVQVPMHDYCKRANFDPMLRAFVGDDGPTPVAHDPRRI